MRKFWCAWTARAERRGVGANEACAGACAVCRETIHRSRGTARDWGPDTGMHASGRLLPWWITEEQGRSPKRHQTGGISTSKCHRSNRPRSHRLGTRLTHMVAPRTQGGQAGSNSVHDGPVEKSGTPAREMGHGGGGIAGVKKRRCVRGPSLERWSHRWAEVRRPGRNRTSKSRSDWHSNGWPATRRGTTELDSISGPRGGGEAAGAGEGENNHRGCETEGPGNRGRT